MEGDILLSCEPGTTFGYFFTIGIMRDFLLNDAFSTIFCGAKKINNAPTTFLKTTHRLPHTVE